MIRILLVEDEPGLYEGLKLNLELEGYHVTLATDGELAITKFRSERFDLIILDIMIPKMSGLDVCETIRLENDKIPIMFLSAKGSNLDKVEGLKRGGDDYMSKPFHLEEFLLRIKNLLKRFADESGNSSVESVFTFDDGSVDFGAFEITTWEGVNKRISKREMKLLKLLIEKEGQVVSREEILSKVWGYNVFPSTRTIDNYILNFRKYFERNPRHPVHIHSVRGVGYRFVR
ncbi:MAG TPA: DNA-binding response regulator [Flavobacteriales bacterium]|jgi:two-component system alkaline phosphatase synthesis response regulator PhoP|nr:DNA-binding response regulator [Flavobacteriales bacterium]